MRRGAYAGRIGGSVLSIGVGCLLLVNQGAAAWADPTDSSATSDSASAAPSLPQPSSSSPTASTATGKTGAAGSPSRPASTPVSASAGSTTTWAPAGVAVSSGGAQHGATTSTGIPTLVGLPDLTAVKGLPGSNSKSRIDATVTTTRRPLQAVTPKESSLASKTVATQVFSKTTPGFAAAPAAIGDVADAAPAVTAAPVVATAQQQAPLATAQPAATVTGVMSNLFRTILNPLAANDTPDSPIGTPAAWSLLAFTRREFDVASSSPALPGAAETGQNSLTYTAPPTLFDQVVVAGLRITGDIFRMFGLDYAGIVGGLIQSEDPPSYLTYGLNAQVSEVEVAPGQFWKTWEFDPPDPTGKTVIAIHGGGFILQPSLFNWSDYTQMARDTGAKVVVPLYPLATSEAGAAINVNPEMANFISRQIDLDGAENVSIYADSAGYTFAFGAVRELILRGDAVPASMVLLSGAADSSLTNPDIRSIDDPYFNPDNVSFWASHEYDGITDLKDPRVSPLYMETDVLKALPPTTIYIGTEEMLLPDNLLLYQRAVDVGAPISMVIGQGQSHDWAALPFNSAAPAVRTDIYRQLGLFDSGERTLILSAFPTEADAILARTTLDRNSTIVVDGHHFYLGTLGGKKVIVAMTGIGMENAADTTETALNYFTRASGIPVGAVVFSGVAGGYGRTEIGDVAVPARWTPDDGVTWRPVDSDMLAAASAVTVDLLSTDSVGDPHCACGLLAGPQIDLKREPELFVGGDGSSDDNNNGVAFPAIPFGGDIFGPQPCAAPDFSLLSTGNFFEALGPFLANGLLSNLTGILNPVSPPVDAVDQETAAAQQVADAHGIPFLGIRGMSDGPGDPLNLPGYPFTFFTYKQIAADNAAIVTEAFLRGWAGPGMSASSVLE